MSTSRIAHKQFFPRCLVLLVFICTTSCIQSASLVSKNVVRPKPNQPNCLLWPCMMDQHEINIHVFTAVAPDKVELDQKVQTKAVKVTDQQVQTEARAQEQDLLLLDVKTSSLAVL